MRVFPDTNVFFAALASRGLCADLLRTLLLDHDVIVGAPVLAELRKNVISKLRIPANRADSALSFLGDLELAPVAAMESKAPPGISIPDQKVLACAAHARIDFMVTGDRALLGLGRYGNYRIVSPRALWTNLRRASRDNP